MEFTILLPKLIPINPFLDSEVVGGINPNISNYIPDGKVFQSGGSFGSNDFIDKNAGETLTAVHFMLKNGLRKAKDSVQHAGDAVHSMRRAVLTIPRSTVQLFYPFYKGIELDQDKDNKPTTGLLGSRAFVPEPTPRLVGAGRLLELIKAAASNEEGVPGISERVSAPLANIKSAIENRKEKYQNFIKKLRDDVKGKIPPSLLN